MDGRVQIESFVRSETSGPASSRVDQAHTEPGSD